MLLACSCGTGPSEPPAIRHVVFLSMDTTRADHLGCYGNPEVQTPALDTLASEGVRFADCTSAAATTLASHTSLMTGTYPHRHGSTRNGFVVNPENVTLAERLREAGFWCAAILGSSALIEATGFAQGFHHYDDDFDVPMARGGADQMQRLAPTVTRAVLEHIDEVLARDGAESARLFVFAQYFDPHAPYAPPAAEARRYGAKLQVGDFDDIESAVRRQQSRVLGEPLGQHRVMTEGLPTALVRSPARTPTATGRELAKLYAGEVSTMDAAIGSLLIGLASRGILDETLVVVTADHGETFWEHGNAWNHGLWVSQTEVHVPLLMRFPNGRGSGRLVEEPVSGVDVAPTILDALGIGSPADDVPDAARGRSVLDLVDGRPLAAVALFTEATQPGTNFERGELPWRNARKPRAARLGPWKLVDAPYLGITQLFHLERDPQETHDLLSDPMLSEEARAARDELQLAMKRWTSAARPLFSEFDATQSNALRALGYAEAVPEEPDTPR